jgi:midasin
MRKLVAEWRALSADVDVLRRQVGDERNGALAFSFAEGALVRALRNGDWILLDEINLGASDALHVVASLLESATSSLVLLDKGDATAVERHPNFRVFSCMNPATDVGKHDLPRSVASRFSSFYVDDVVNVDDLKLVASNVLRAPTAPYEAVISLYLR